MRIIILQRRPEANPLACQPLPVEKLAWINFTHGGNVGMPHHVHGLYGVAFYDAAAQFSHRLHLDLREWAVPKPVSGVYYLNAYRDIIDIPGAAPVAHTSVPGAVCFIHKAIYCAVFVHHIMR